MSESNRLQPLFLVKPGTVSRADIKRAEKLGGVCIIECAEPESARYSEPPITADIDVQARAAISLMRFIIDAPSPEFKRGDLTKLFVQILLKGKYPTETTPVPSVKK